VTNLGGFGFPRTDGIRTRDLTFRQEVALSAELQP
jgi:hypothetical protein